MIDPLSCEMGSERTCLVVHFQKVQGGKLKAQFLSHLFTDFVHFTQVYSNRPKLHPRKK